ncbi:MAG: alternative ribosome rescue aminoacyl-tRNA hydrolase ArfB [Candidatus Auribacterota bacterium]|nr:alternative ribosome rescue aminoacyl-tRNA hydrolase ArfB [Candidatus Auribacterota bacterium]
MIYVTRTISIPDNEITENFIRASGPGGQNVNKVATAVQLRFDIRHSTSLPDAVRRRLIRLAGRRMTGEGVLIIDAKRFRTQAANRNDATERLIELIRRAARPPRRRRKTRPTRAAKERRLKVKHQRSRIKQSRKTVAADDDF